MVTIHDKGSDNVRLRSGSCHVMTKKILIWVPICKEKRMKNSGESDFRHTEDHLEDTTMGPWEEIIAIYHLLDHLKDHPLKDPFK